MGWLKFMIYIQKVLGGPSSSSDHDSDIDWPFSGELEHSLCLDGSISDEESLIEIALPSGQFVNDNPKLSFHQYHQKVFADLVQPESIFQQHCLMDFLADISDVYEEDNLIDIDISMGSIKCSGYEFQHKWLYIKFSDVYLFNTVLICLSVSEVF
ncbi:hypothetical protein K7X08_025159 [Anisodus acutangulus]|uniref:Uncharacterized protein n=1 Tax=Anisodus acutangulus TaxID=402998 RepID=A0A9Q1RDL5_9SOLA|nr:hypothetical protein K7X08_025159 [Anisodus acutangulus]